MVEYKWVYKKKNESTNTDEKIFNIRLMAKEFTQRKAVNYNEVSAPKAKYFTIRLLCVIVILYDLMLNGC